MVCIASTRASAFLYLMLRAGTVLFTGFDVHWPQAKTDESGRERAEVRYPKQQMHESGKWCLFPARAFAALPGMPV
jgi:hypothetical protein